MWLMNIFKVEYFLFFVSVSLFFSIAVSHQLIEILRYLFIVFFIVRFKKLRFVFKSKGFKLLSLFVLIALASCIVNSTSLKLDRVLNWVVIFLIGYCSAFFVEEEKKLLDFCVNCLVIGLTLMFIKDSFFKNIGYRYSGGLNSPNQLAIIILIPMYYYLFKFWRNLRLLVGEWRNVVLYFLGFIVFYGLLILTGARAVFWVNTFLVISSPFLFFKNKKCMLCSILIFLLLISVVYRTAYKDRFITSVINFKQDSSFLERYPIWFAAFYCFKEKPLLGIGFDRFRSCYRDNYLLFLKKYPHWPHIKNTNHAHNFFLHFLAETGILGLLVMLIIWGLASYYAFKKSEYMFISFILIGSLGGFMLNMNFYIREISILIMFIIGWIFSVEEKGSIYV